MKHTNKTTKRAFTLIELLIVIAIIGILFVVLISKVDFATDKAKASGVQTDFRSFQMAFETVSKENAGFASLGWDTGDENGNRKRDSYDEGDTNQNNIMESTETWTGHKVPGEDWTGTYTLVNPDDDTDKSAFKLLEDKVNANLDPKLHIIITPEENAGVLTGNAKVTMANAAKDPWKNEYHGVYITNAQNDKADRGAFIIYSNGTNGQWGSEHDIANGKVSINVPGNNVRGKDDMSIAVSYTYVNGYGENAVITTGFSNNQNFLAQGNSGELSYLDDENNFIYSGIKYHLWSSSGISVMFDESNNVVLYEYDGSVIGMVPASCITITEKNVYINGAGEDYDGKYMYKNNGTEMWKLNDDGTMWIVAVQEGYCNHQDRYYGSERLTQWYNWYDGYEWVGLGSPPTLEQLKNYTLRCETCLTEIPTRIFDDSKYVYIYNGWMEPQYEATNIVLGGRCVDSGYENLNGWAAIPYIVSEPTNCYDYIDGESVKSIIVVDETVIPTTIKFAYSLYYLDDDIELTYLGTKSQFGMIKHGYRDGMLIDELRQIASGNAKITVHCSDGDIVFE